MLSISYIFFLNSYFFLSYKQNFPLHKILGKPARKCDFS